MANVKNYTEQGGENTIIGGNLKIATGGKFYFGNTEFKQSAAVAAAAGANPTKAEFDALITALKNAGIMKTE